MNSGVGGILKLFFFWKEGVEGVEKLVLFGSLSDLLRSLENADALGCKLV